MDIPNVCDTCNAPRPTVQWRDNGSQECDRCWADSLQHGHVQGMHERPITGCPLCPLADAIAPNA